MRILLALTLLMTFALPDRSIAALVAHVGTNLRRDTGRIKASDVHIPIGDSGKFVSLQELSTMSVADVEQMAGKKMRRVQRMEIGASIRALRRRIAPDGTIDRTLVSRLRLTVDRLDNHFHLGGFLLGALPFWGILIAYLIHDKSRHRRIRWAWLGFAIIYGSLSILIGTAYATLPGPH